METVKIIGHFGYLDRSGSTYGLKYLLCEVLPELEKILDDYEIHVIGAGEPVPFIKEKLKHPRIKLRGWVEDLNSELIQADCVLLLNNAGDYQAAYTRHLVCWALKACLVVHGLSEFAIPQMNYRENVMFGYTPTNIAVRIKEVVTNKTLNQHIRNGGYQTYLTHFAPKVVAGKINDEINLLVEKSK
jgi:glycosyltransferase involved in cell wall biosynthesis